jgi:hypothetical protein
MRKAFKILTLLTAATVVLIISVIVLSPSWYRFLRHNKSVESQIMVLEAWVPSYVIEEAAREFQRGNYSKIIVVGAEYLLNPPPASQNVEPLDRSKYSLFKNGFIEINRSVVNNLLKGKKDSVTITVDATGRDVLEVTSHFTLVIDNEIIGSSFTSEKYQEYSFRYLPGSKPVESMSILFLNDTFIPGHDRNLNVRGVKIDSTPLPLNDTVFNVIHQSERSVMPEIVVFKSIAESTAYYLKCLGIPDSAIISLSSDYYDRNKTLSNARRVAGWIASSPFSESNLNIHTFDIHSRRTYLTFRKELDSSVRVGTIMSPNMVITDYNWRENRKGIRYVAAETAKYLYALVTSPFT